MPNWVTSRTTITGKESDLKEIRELLARPYITYSQDFMTNEIKQVTSEGLFQLWNIASPTDLASYYGFTSDEAFAERQERVKKAEQDKPENPQEFVEKLQEAMKDIPPLTESVMMDFQRDIETKQDWYHWNIREWGTKWDIDNAEIEVYPNKIIYIYNTAWSPPVSALDKLAEQYPFVSIHSRFIDENDCFAGEVYWESGGQTYDRDVRIDHALKVEMYGDCWACANDDEEYDDLRKEYKCAEYNKLVVPNTLEGIQ